MYRHTLRIHDEQPVREQVLPKDSTAPGNGGEHRLGGLLGGAEMVMVAVTPVSLGDGRSLSLGMEDSSDGTTFSALPVTFRRTVSGGPRTWNPGEVLARLPVPSDCRSRVRAVLGTDDPEAAGKVDVIFDFRPR